MSVINAVVFIEMQFSVWLIFTSCLCLCVCFRQWWSGYQYHRDGRRSWHGSGETGNLCQDGHRGWSRAERRQVTRPTRPPRACLCLRVSRMMTLLSVICLLSTKLSASLMQTPVATLKFPSATHGSVPTHVRDYFQSWVNTHLKIKGIFCYTPQDWKLEMCGWIAFWVEVDELWWRLTCKPHVCYHNASKGLHFLSTSVSETLEQTL